MVGRTLRPKANIWGYGVVVISSSIDTAAVTALSMTTMGAIPPLTLLSAKTRLKTSAYHANGRIRSTGRFDIKNAINNNASAMTKTIASVLMTTATITSATIATLDKAGALCIALSRLYARLSINAMSITALLKSSSLALSGWCSDDFGAHPQDKLDD